MEGNPANETPKILRECVELFLSPKHNHYPIPIEININEKYATHPDIQYFKKLKAKNHYNYHKFKRTPQKVQKFDNLLVSDFDPFSRPGLLERLSSFTTLNWRIPGTIEDVNELRCAQNGWRCISISINNNSKNHLVCTSCRKLVTLRFNDMNFSSQLDTQDYQDLNTHLAQEYLKQIQVLAHDSNCPWRNFETPLEGIYYINPFLHGSDELLIFNYLNCVKTLVENRTVLIGNSEVFDDIINESLSKPQIQEFVKISKLWLLTKFYNDEKENSTNLDSVPDWVYLIALNSWEFKVQSFSNQLILFLVCPQCNKRVFIESVAHRPISKYDYKASQPSLELSSSKILTPVKYPAKVPTDENEESIDILEEHKHWCLMKRGFKNTSVAQYVFEAVLESEKQIGPNGEYLERVDVPMDMNLDSTKRRTSFNIDEGLERLNKLRKLYLSE